MRAADRAIRPRSTADVIADIKTPPPLSAYPRARGILEAHAESVSERLTGITDKSGSPISDEFVLALRAESAGDNAAALATLPLVTVAIVLAPLEQFTS